MKTTNAVRWARYLGIGAAVLVPAWVVAQTVGDLPLTTNLEPNDVLRSQDLQAMRNALATLIGRVAALEGRPQVSTGLLYNARVTQLAIAPGGLDSVSGTCDDATDVMVNCGCRGLSDVGTNSTFFQLRQSRIDVPVGSTARCVCQGFNSGGTSSNLVATATCLRLP